MTTDVTSPAEAQARRLERVGEGLKALFNQPAVAQRWHAAQGSEVWSAMQTLGHMVEMLPYWLHHCQTLIAASEPPAFGRTLDAPERLAGVERGASAEPTEVLRQLEDELRTTANALRLMSETERGKKGLHVRRGEMTVADVVDFFIVAHAEEHLEQVRTALES